MQINKENSINNLIQNLFNEEHYKKYYSSVYSNIDKYFSTKYVLNDNYLKTIDYFIFKDNYPQFRTNISSLIHPVIPSKRLNLGLGTYGMNFVGLNEIYINENNTDIINEVFWHEQLHSSNPNLSEKEVRDIIRLRYHETKYH